MRHLSILVIFGALLLQGCDRHRESKVSKVVPIQEEISRQEYIEIPAPLPEPVAKEEPAVTESVPAEEEMAPAPLIYEEEILIPPTSFL